eukprot:SAG31_NODE_14029_length_831_cov_0.707650_1_plen_173_part_00
MRTVKTLFPAEKLIARHEKDRTRSAWPLLGHCSILCSETVPRAAKPVMNGRSQSCRRPNLPAAFRTTTRLCTAQPATGSSATFLGYAHTKPFFDAATHSPETAAGRRCCHEYSSSPLETSPATCTTMQTSNKKPVNRRWRSIRPGCGSKQWCHGHNCDIRIVLTYIIIYISF